MPSTTRSDVQRPSGREVVFSRLLDAPPQTVWNAWSEPEQLHRWYGPTGFTTTTHEFDFVPGGVWRFTMHSPDGIDNPNRVVFRDIVPPSRLVYDNSWDEPGASLAFELTALFVPEGTGTRLSIRMRFRDDDAIRTAVEHYGVLEGGTQTLDRIAEQLRGAA